MGTRDQLDLSGWTAKGAGAVRDHGPEWMLVLPTAEGSHRGIIGPKLPFEQIGRMSPLEVKEVDKISVLILKRRDKCGFQ